MLKKQIIYKAAVFSFLSFIFAYIIVRACSLSFTIDESISYSIFTNDTGMSATANNHLLNTWLMQFFYMLFGMGEIILRLPNVLSFLLFAFFVYKILDRLHQPVLMLTGFFLILVNPYFVEFFGLARGYGMSWSMAAGALFFLIRGFSGPLVPKQFITNMALSMLFSVPAVCANLNMLNFMLVLLVLFLFKIMLYVVRKGEGRLRLVLGTLIVLIVVAAALYVPFNQLMQLKKSGQLYFGGNENFFNNTLTTIVFFSEYMNYHTETILKTIRVFMIATVALGLIMAVAFRPVNREFRVLLAVLLLFVAVPVAQFYMLKTPYPMNRTALFYLPVYALFLTYLIAEISQRLKTAGRRFVQISIMVLIAVPLWYNFAISMNYKYAFEWIFDQDTKEAMYTVKQRYQQGIYGKAELSIANDWLNEPSINYYRAYYDMEFLKAANRGSINQEADIYYGPTGMIRSVSIPGIRVVDYFEGSGCFLAERNVATTHKKP